MEYEEDSKAVNFDEILVQPLKYFEQKSGKQTRKKFMKALNFWLKIPSQKCVEIEKILHMLHIFLFLMDDIEDCSELRKGIPTAHNIFGVRMVINSAKYAYYLVLEKILNLGHPESTKVFSEHILELVRGQGMDIYWRDNFLCPSEDEYKEMIKRKTGGFIDFIVKLMQLFSDNKSDFSEIVSTLALYFQIINDYGNLQSEEYTEDKGFCEDLTEGKFSLPIIHSIRGNLDDPRLMNIVRQRTTDIDIKKCALDIMEETGSFAYCRKVLMDLNAQARREIERIGQNALLLSLLDE